MTPKELILKEAELTTQELKKSIQNLKSVALSEAWKILQLVLAQTVQVIEHVATDLAGSEKKKIAIEFISNFYDVTFSVIDIPLVPSMVEAIIDKYTKSILMIMVSSSIDAIVQIFRETGVFIRKEANNG